MRYFMPIFYIFLLLLGVSFAVLNAAPVSLNLYVATYSLPLSLMIVVTLSLGAILGFLFNSGRSLRLRLENHRLKNQLELSEKEIKNLRSIPLQD